jgi:hypothetical protein
MEKNVQKSLGSNFVAMEKMFKNPLETIWLPWKCSKIPWKQFGCHGKNVQKSHGNNSVAMEKKCSKIPWKQFGCHGKNVQKSLGNDLVAMEKK